MNPARCRNRAAAGHFRLLRGMLVIDDHLVILALIEVRDHRRQVIGGDGKLMGVLYPSPRYNDRNFVRRPPRNFDLLTKAGQQHRDATNPLTPALSPGERGKRSQLSVMVER